jgi:hypothetical protein
MYLSNLILMDTFFGLDLSLYYPSSQYMNPILLLTLLFLFHIQEYVFG